jgi:hypothetical protein
VKLVSSTLVCGICFRGTEGVVMVSLSIEG